MPEPIRLEVVPYQPRLLLAQILDAGSYIKTGSKKGISQQGQEEQGNKLRRYKITVLEYSDNSDPLQAPWAIPRSTTSGTGAFKGPYPVYTKGSFVYVVEDENGDYEIVACAPNVSPEIRQQFKLGEASSGHDERITPTKGLTPDGRSRVSEQFSLDKDTKEDLSQDEQDRIEAVFSSCEQFVLDAGEINSDIVNWIKEIDNLKEGLTGSDSFLSTAQSQIDTIISYPSQATSFLDQQIANLTKNTALKNAKSIAGLIQEIRRFVLRKTTALINNAIGFAPLSTRYLANQAKNETLEIISCLFLRILQNLEGLIANALGSLVNRILNGATCFVENFIGNLLGQLISQITNLVNAALGPISSLLGSVISFTNEVLEFAKSILNFLKCDIKNICTKITKYNPLNGPVPEKVSFDFDRVFDAAKGVFDDFRGLADIPENLNDYNFSLDIGSIVNASLDNCGLGPESCGPPNVVFWGGNGSGASGNAVLNVFGDIIGVDIVSGGSYTSPPLISFEDNCGNGHGAVGIPVLGPTPTDGDDGDDDDGDDGDLTDGETSPDPGFPVVDVVIPNTGYDYLPVPDGSKGGSGRTWAGRCQTIVQRANGKWDTPYSEGRVIRLFYGDKITLPGKPEVIIDCDFTSAKLPGSIETGEKYCYVSMVGFDDGSGFYVTPPNIKSMIGFDDTLYGQVPERVFPTSIEFQKYWDELAATPRGAELLAESDEEWNAALGYIPSGGRPDQFGYAQDYPYARSLGFSDQDIRFYIEGYYSKLLGKRVGGIMKLKLEDPDFGPLPSWIAGRAGAGLFDCENDYPYALSLGYNDKDIRYYLENVYLGEVDECMQRKLNDPNWGRVVYYVDVTAPGCPDDGVLDDQYNVDSSIGSIFIEDGGFGYNDGDTATVLDCSGSPDAAAKLEIRVNQDGTIIRVDVINPGRNFQCIPEIVLNSDTGINARLLPVLRFNRVGEFDVPEGTVPLQVIDCVGKV